MTPTAHATHQDSASPVITRPRTDPVGLVNEFLRLLMIPDPEAARHLASPALQIRFTGGRAMQDVAECAAFNRGRYAWVKKRFGPTELVAGATDALAIVYQRGELYGAWPDNKPFEGNRYVDRYEVSQGLITRMDVWNDSAEWLLDRAAPASAPP
jgi:hypothetical protein